MNEGRTRVEKLAMGFVDETMHSRHVAKLSKALFDCSAELHGLGTRERELLVYAALLHDIGWCGGRRAHHKRSCDLILENPPEDLMPGEVGVVANVARYHRRALPKLSHDAFAVLAPPDREVVRRLSALIRIADGLDVTHSCRVSVVGCLIGLKEVVIGISGGEGYLPELEQAKKKSDLFEQVFERTVRFNLH